MDLRILHFGDVHLPFPAGALRTPAVLHPKRIPALLNFYAGRGWKYLEGEKKLNALCEFLRREPADWVLYAGDSVNMGLAREFLSAAPKIGAVLSAARKGALAVPGNHDLYTRGAVGAFRRWMGGAPEGDRPGLRTAAGWPVVKFLDESAVVVGLNTACPHLAFWNSSGRLAKDELERLERLLDDPEIGGRDYVLLLTHYPLDEAGFFHGMRGTEAIAKVLAGRNNLFVLHGHNHSNYLRYFPGTSIPLYCSGSLTKDKAEAFWFYEPFGGTLNARRGRWKNARWVLEEPDAGD